MAFGGRKQAAKVSGGVVASAIAGNAAPLMIPLFEWAADLLEDRRSKGRVERDFRKRCGRLSEGEVTVALAQAHAAIESSRFSIGDAIRLNLDPASSTTAIAECLDWTLSDSEDQLARLAIRVWCDELFRDARKENSVIFEMIAECLRRLSEIENVPPAKEGVLENSVMRNAVTRWSATRLLADSTRSESFHGDCADRCLDSMRWDWNVEASAHLSSVVQLRDRDGFDLGSALDVLKSVDWSSDALCTWWHLSSEEVSESLRVLESWARDARLLDIALSLRWLRGEVKAPQFGFVLPVHGSWGSGRSRLLEEIVLRGLDQGATSLHLDVRGSLSDAIEQAIRVAAGGASTSLQSICDSSERVLVVIDDFDAIVARAPDVFDEFWQLVAAWNGRSVRWVVACDEASLPLMMKRGGHRFWTQYGVRPTAGLGSDAVAGWLALDDCNERTNLGLSILEESGRGDQVELQQLAAGAVAGYPLRRELNRPLTALLRLREHSESPLDEIHLMSLMATYWCLLVENLELSDLADPEQVDHLVRLLARQSLEIAIPAGQSESFAMALGMTPEARGDELMMSALTRRKVVEIHECSYVPGAEMNPLWGYLYCREFGLSDSPERDVTVWRGAAETLRLLQMDAHHEADRALRFLFVWAAQRAAVHEGFDLTPWWDAVEDPDFPCEILWEAAVSLPEPRIASLVASTRNRSVGSNEIFWILRLMRLTSWRTDNAAIGIELVTRTFSRIDTLELSTYAELALEKVIDAFPWASPSDSKKALARLSTLTSVPLSWVAAERVVERLELQSADTRAAWLAVLFKVMKATQEPENIASVEMDLSDEDLPFWLAVIRCSLRRIAVAAGPKMIDELIQVGLFDDDVFRSSTSQRIARLAQREAHNAFARTFDDSPEEFTVQALKFARGSVPGVGLETQALIALFGVRHTRSTRGNSVVRVDRRLRVVTEALRQSQHLPSRRRERLMSIEFDAE